MSIARSTWLPNISATAASQRPDSAAPRSDTLAPSAVPLGRSRSSHRLRTGGCQSAGVAPAFADQVCDRAEHPNPFVQPFNGDRPEHMQIRPTRWRIRGTQDYLDDLEDPPEDEDYDVLSDA
jgi:hypothetical protein